MTKKFLDIQHSRMGIEETDKETFAKNLVTYADELADIESRNNPKEISAAKAKGLHQFKDATVAAVLNNFMSGKIAIDKDIIDAVRAASKKDPRDWNRDESNLMVLGHMFLTSEKKTYNDKTMSTDPLLKIIGTAKEQDDRYIEAAEFLYMKFHWRGDEKSPEYNKALENFRGRYNPVMSFKYKLQGINRERSFAEVSRPTEDTFAGVPPIGATRTNVPPLPEEEENLFAKIQEVYNRYISPEAERVSRDYNTEEEIEAPVWENREYQEAYEARERAKLRDLWMPVDGDLKYDSYPGITFDATTGEELKQPTDNIPNYPHMYDSEPAVEEPDWKGGMRKHSRTSDYRDPYAEGGEVRQPYVVGGLVSRAANKISKFMSDFASKDPSKQSLRKQANTLEDYIAKDFSFTPREEGLNVKKKKKKAKEIKRPKKPSLLFKDDWDKRFLTNIYKRDLLRYENRNMSVIPDSLKKYVSELEEAKADTRYLKDIIKVKQSKLQNMKFDYKLNDKEYLEALKSLALIKNEQLVRTITLMKPFISKKVRKKLGLREVEDALMPEPTEHDLITLLDDYKPENIDIGQKKLKDDLIDSFMETKQAPYKAMIEDIKRIHSKGTANVSQADEEELLVHIDSFLATTNSQGEVGFIPNKFTDDNSVNQAIDLFDYRKEMKRIREKRNPVYTPDPNVPENVTPLGPALVFDKETGKFVMTPPDDEIPF